MRSASKGRTRKRDAKGVGARHRAEVLFHPERLRIVQTLANAKGLTTQQLAARLPDIAPATLYRHLKRLTAAGVVIVAAERQVRGVKERTYTVTQETAFIGPAEMSAFSKEERFSFFAQFVAALLDQYGRFLSSRTGSEVTTVSYRQTPLYLSDEEMSAFLEELRGLLYKYLENGPTRGRKRRLFTITLMPDVAPAEKDPSD